MKLGRSKLLAVLAVLAFTAMFGWTMGSQAHADPACDGSGLFPCRGYFYNRLPPDEDEIHDMYAPHRLGLFADDIDELVSMIRTRLECSNGVLPQSKQNPASAAFTVLTMLGAPDQTPKNTACARFAEWESLVRQYDAKGLIQYRVLYDYYRNSAYDGINYDAVRHPEDDIDWSIVIYSESGSVLVAIERICGNMLDEIRALPPLQPPTGTINPPVTPPDPPGTVPGNPSVNSSCSQITGTAYDPNAPSFPVPVTITYVMNGNNIGTQTVAASTAGSRVYQSNTPPSVLNSTAPVTVTATGRDSTNASFPIGSITIGPCLTAPATCGSMTPTPNPVDPSTPFTITTSVQYASLVAATAVRNQPDFSYFITITGPAGYNYVNNAVAASQPNGTFAITGAVNRPASAVSGEYMVGWGIRGSFGAINCGAAIPGNPDPPSFTIAPRLFFRINGGDIAAGTGMHLGDNLCTEPDGYAPHPEASIVSWNRGAAGSYAGAGSQHAAFSLNRIQGFVTGRGSAYDPGGLSFANTGGPSNHYDPNAASDGGLYGGKLGNMPCLPDYLAGATGGIPGNQVVLSSVLGIAPGSTYTVGDGITPAKRTVYVSDGNLLVDVNVQLTATGNFASVAAIPSFAALVRGNIYIAPGITRLDGIYVAQPSYASATNGIVYSCAPNGFNTSAANVLTRNLYGQCNQQLTINGAVVARQVWLLRTFGSLQANTPAEVINYSPEVWLNAPFTGGLNPVVTKDYDSITGLPPIL